MTDNTDIKLFAAADGSIEPQLALCLVLGELILLALLCMCFY